MLASRGMTTSQTFDISLFQTVPQADTPSMIALGNRLLQLVPKKSTAEVKAGAKKMRMALDALSSAFSAPTGKPASTKAKRQADVRIDRAWGALYYRIEACASLPNDEYPDAAEATHILDTFFAEGLAFLLLPYETEWAESDKRLMQIDADSNLSKTLDRIAGTLYVAEIRKAHDLYGAALGTTAATAQSEDSSLSLDGPLKAFRKGVAQYARALLATVDEDEPTTITALFNALSPLVELRDRLAASKTKAPAEVEPKAG